MEPRVAVYLCMKDKQDLTLLVNRVLVDPGRDLLNFDVLVEGRSTERGVQIQESNLDDLAQASEDVTSVVVRCPECGTENLFFVARLGML
jgi:hypothetical protein